MCLNVCRFSETLFFFVLFFLVQNSNYSATHIEIVTEKRFLKRIGQSTPAKLYPVFDVFTFDRIWRWFQGVFSWRVARWAGIDRKVLVPIHSQRRWGGWYPRSCSSKSFEKKYEIQPGDTVFVHDPIITNPDNTVQIGIKILHFSTWLETATSPHPL